MERSFLMDNEASGRGTLLNRRNLVAPVHWNRTRSAVGMAIERSQVQLSPCYDHGSKPHKWGVGVVEVVSSQRTQMLQLRNQIFQSLHLLF